MTTARETAIDLVSTPEIAQMLGVEDVTVRQWRARGTRVPMPEPIAVVGSMPIYSRAEIEAWARESGRMPS